MEDKVFTETMEYIVASLKERGYDPYMQLLGYVTHNETSYITSNRGARSLIQTLDFEKVKQYVAEMKQKDI